MTGLNMFPTVEVSQLSATSFSTLDDLCILEENQPIMFNNMADNASLEQFLGPYTQASAEGFNLDLNTEDQGCQALDIINQTFCANNSLDTSHSIETNLFGTFDPPVLYPSVAENTVSEEGIYCEESTKFDSEPLVSSSNDVPVDHHVNKTENLAAKKYLKMREKNNIASQRSRKLRKQKNLELVKKLQSLETENKELKSQVALMEKETDALKKLLFEVISKK